MQIGMIEGHTRICGKSQGYAGLPVRDEMVVCTVNGPTPAMTTAWLPTPDQIARIVAGAPVLVQILGTVPPPMLVDVGRPPE